NERANLGKWSLRIPRKAVFPEADLENSPEVAGPDMARPKGIALLAGGSSSPAAAAGEQEEESHFYLNLHLRQGPIAAGVAWNSAWNEPKESKNTYVCDDIRCEDVLWTGYPYDDNKGHFASTASSSDVAAPASLHEPSPFLANGGDGRYDWENGFFSGWSGMFAVTLILTMLQYFLNA
ncbi:unnamed protein product, partial [Amoebophrya sp. A25]